MNRDEAVRTLQTEDVLDYLTLDGIFQAFGFVSTSPSWDTDVYYHPRYPTCGGFTARDDGLHGLTPRQRALVAAMISCVQWSEKNG
jgi:hypothetical protein